MGNTTSLTASAQEFFTVIVSGRSLYVGSAFSIFLASIIAPFLADIILGTIAMALSSKGYVHVALMANAGTVSIVKDMFRVSPEGRSKGHFGVGCSVLILAIVIAAIPAAIHQLLVPALNPPIATVWPLNAKTNEVAFSERFGKRRANVEWCVPRDGPSQTVASSVGSMVAKFNANPNCKEGLNLTVGFQTMRQIVTPSNLLAALESSTMTRLSRVGPSGAAVLGLDVPLSRKTDIKYAVAMYYEGLSSLSPSGSEGCDAAVTAVVTISKTNNTPTAIEIDCTAYGVDLHDKKVWEFMMCYDHGTYTRYTANRTVAIFVSTKSQGTGSAWDFVYHAYMPNSQDFRLSADWKRRNYTVLPSTSPGFGPINMEDMHLVERRVDNIAIQEFVGQRDCDALKGTSAFENDGTADQYILGAWQQSNNIVHTAFSNHEATARDKILIEFTGWQGCLFVSLFLISTILAGVLQPSMSSLLVHIVCSNSLLSTSIRSKPWYTKTGFFVRENAQGDRFVSCEENSASNKPITFKEATRSCRESEKLSGYSAAYSVNGFPRYEPL
ncbi:hypothetical protein BJ741DRAFT_659234 [Chytriomyces cf. hyalinus JEL632]|nr:hypothetical protein BJ741DRAFT_659234 [Chytriomyces cf. hyalinus JEL632]